MAILFVVSFTLFKIKESIKLIYIHSCRKLNDQQW